MVDMQKGEGFEELSKFITSFHLCKRFSSLGLLDSFRWLQAERTLFPASGLEKHNAFIMQKRNRNIMTFPSAQTHPLCTLSGL